MLLHRVHGNAVRKAGSCHESLDVVSIRVARHYVNGTLRPGTNHGEQVGINGMRPFKGRRAATRRAHGPVPVQVGQIGINILRKRETFLPVASDEPALGARPRIAHETPIRVRTEGRRARFAVRAPSELETLVDFARDAYESMDPQAREPSRADPTRRLLEARLRSLLRAEPAQEMRRPSLVAEDAHHAGKFALAHPPTPREQVPYPKTARDEHRRRRAEVRVARHEQPLGGNVRDASKPRGLIFKGLHRAVELVQLLSHATRARHAPQDGPVSVSSVRDAFRSRSARRRRAHVDEVRRRLQLGDAPSELTKVRLEVAQAADELRTHPQRLDGAFRHEGLANKRDDPRGPAEAGESVHRSREVSGAAFLPSCRWEMFVVAAAVGLVHLVHLVDRRVPVGFIGFI
mmetsp:Transcript_6027/g.24691  ORF Transcript_6027/g.24691 Transcript_6027/m.24691 type:complete len:404 (+) Transcript_6027:1291-2502(+)